MKKALAIMFVTLLLMGLASNGLADELTLKDSGPGQWTIYDSGGQDLGTLSRVGQGDPIESEAGGYSIRPKGGDYLGIIRSDGALQLLVRHAIVSPSQVRLYLDVLEALKTLK
jgi:hypothetical protein